MERLQLYGVILPWLWLLQDFSFYYEHSVPETGSGYTTSIGINSHLDQSMKMSKRH